MDKFVDKGRVVPGIIDWLKEHGKTHGWRRVDARMAQQMANEEHPSIAIWENPDPKSSGHIAMIRPGSIGDKRGTAISQAGVSFLMRRTSKKALKTRIMKSVSNTGIMNNQSDKRRKGR